MKKFTIATLVALTTFTASATTEIGITGGVNYHQSAPYGFGNGCGFIAGPFTCTQGQNRNEYGFTFGKKLDKISVTAGLSQSTGGASITHPTDGPYKNNTQNRISLVGGYDLATLGPVTFTAKVGGAYLDNNREKDGYVLTAGAGVSVPVTKQISFGVDYVHQYGQKSVAQYDGNRASANVKYTF